MEGRSPVGDEPGSGSGRKRIARLRGAALCGARTRRGTPCRAPAVGGRQRCRMHGGAKGGGAPRGNRNRLTHGFYTAASVRDRRRLTALMRAGRRVLEEME